MTLLPVTKFKSYVTPSPTLTVIILSYSLEYFGDAELDLKKSYVCTCKLSMSEKSHLHELLKEPKCV